MLPVIRVEPVGIHRVADPNPPQGYESEDVLPELGWVKMTLVRVVQDIRYVTDRYHKNQVEEQLQPGGTAIEFKIFCVVHFGPNK